MKNKEYLNDIVIDYKHTWILQVNVDLIIKKWNHLWYIYYSNFWDKPKYRLVKLLRKDSEITDIKVAITKKQTLEIVDKLSLNYYKSYIFKNAGHRDNKVI